MNDVTSNLSLYNPNRMTEWQPVKSHWERDASTAIQKKHIPKSIEEARELVFSPGMISRHQFTEIELHVGIKCLLSLLGPIAKQNSKGTQEKSKVNSFGK